MNYKFRTIGLSSDGRTNKWRLTLPCSHTVEPWTTMYAQQEVQCGDCGKLFLVDYNLQTMSEVEA